MDTSSVFHVSLLDAEFQKDHNPATPWIFETDNGQWEFATEEQACAEQRAYREQTGHHPITGERID